MNKITTYFRESYKELTGKSDLANLGTIAAVNNDCTGSHPDHYSVGMGNGPCAQSVL